MFNWLVPLVHLSSLDYLLRVQATSLACSLRLYSFLIIYRVGYMLSFATAVELMAITKSWKSIKNGAKTYWKSHIRRREIVKIILHERVKRVSRGGI